MDPSNLEIDVAALARDAQQERQSGEDVDEALLRVCKRRYGAQGMVAFEGARQALQVLAQQSGTDVSGALERAAGGRGFARAHVKVTTKVTTNRREVNSLDELSPEVRDQVEKALAEGAGTRTIHLANASLQSEPQSPPAVAPNTALCRCERCGYASAEQFSTCPQCSAPRQRSIWSRLFGR